jgi:hypothetical protein
LLLVVGWQRVWEWVLRWLLLRCSCCMVLQGLLKS